MLNKPKSESQSYDHKGEDLDEDELFAELEDSSNEPPALRERRLQQLHEEFARARALRQQDHGTYMTMSSEKEILDLTTGNALSVVHFLKPNFHRCRIMDAHLKALADWHLETRFVRAEVENVPWLVEKLQIQVLPCVISFVHGKTVDRLLGFEGVGRGTDSFTTAELESRLVAFGVLTERKMQDEPAGKKRFDGTLNVARQDIDKDENDDDDDWD